MPRSRRVVEVVGESRKGEKYEEGDGVVDQGLHLLLLIVD
jgi:hypothetical protein